MRKKLLSMFLVLCMVCTMLPTSAMAEEVHTTNDANGESIEFADLEETVKTVPIGTSFEDLEQPETQTVTVRTTVKGVDDIASTVSGPAIKVSYGIWVGGVEVTSENYGNITGEGIASGTVSYDPDSYTLTLDNAFINGAYADDGNTYGIYANNSLELERIGENIITTPSPVVGFDSAGIHVFGNLTISGGGDLMITAGADGSSYGIHIEDGDLTVKGGSLTATGVATSSSSESYGICVHDRNMTIEDEGSVNAYGGDGGDASYGVYLGGSAIGLTVENGSSLKASGGDSETGASTANFSYGIYFIDSSSELMVDGGSVTAIGCSVVKESCGLLVFQVTVDGGATLEASGGSTAGGSDSTSYGIISNNIFINGGKVEVDSGAADRSQAMSKVPAFGSYDFTINAGTNGSDATVVTEQELADGIDGYRYRYVVIEPVTSYDVWVGDVRVTSANKDLITCECIEGIVTYDPDSATLTLNGAIITDTAHKDENGNSCGIYAAGDLNLVRIGDNKIVIPSPDAEKDGNGIFVSGKLTISGDGSLVVTGGQVTSEDHGSSYGIHVEDGDLTVKGGSLTATGAAAGSSSGGSYGICIHDGNLTIDDEASVIAYADDAGMVSCGVTLGGSNTSLTVKSGSSLIATGGDPVIGASTANLSFGIQADGLLTELIVDGSVTAISYSEVEESCGIRVSEIIVNGNATLEAIGGSAADVSYGISSSHIAINGGTVEVASSEAGISQAMSTAPIFGSGYTYTINAGSDGGDATYVTGAELTRGISGYKYIEITSRIQNGGGSGDGGGSGSGGSYTPAPAPTTRPSGPGTGITESKATVDSSGNASIRITEKDITDAIANVKAEAEKNGVSADDIRVVIYVSTEDTDTSNFTINLPKSAQQQIIDNEIAGIELVIDPDITVGINQLAMTEINRQANADVQITITKTDSTKLSTAAKDAIGSRPVYDFEASYQNGSKKVTNFGSGMVYVSIPYTPAEDEVVGYLHIVYVDGKGKTSRVMESTYDANSESLIFASNHFSLYGVGYTAPSAKFTDISTHWAKDSIDYVVGRGLLSGTTKTTFSPGLALTREVLVTALGKLAGVDTKAYTKNSFTDVKAKSPSRPYIEWAYSKGIIPGIGDNQFEPYHGITREEMAVILANYAKAMNYKLPATRSAIEFTDASTIGSIYADAVKSMQQAGIMMGKANNKFNPKAVVTRAEVSAMIHRLVKLTIDPTAAQGWVQNDDGQYMYYLDSRMVSVEWLQIDGKWYYFNTDGVLARSTKIDEFEVDENGVRKTK